MATTKTGYGRIAKQVPHCNEKSVEEIINHESVAVRRRDRREIRQNWTSDFQGYQAAMDSCGASDFNLNSLDY